MTEVLEIAGQIADSAASVLLTGESGTGKELIARALHFRSRRQQAPFVPVNCAAIPDNLLESELFGHVKRRLHRRPPEPRPAFFRPRAAAPCSSTKSARCR